MIKKDIVENVVSSTGMSKTEVENVINTALYEIGASLVKGENVYLRGLGTFKIVVRAEKIAQNVHKHTSVVVPAHKAISFVPSIKLAERVSSLNVKK